MKTKVIVLILVPSVIVAIGCSFIPAVIAEPTSSSDWAVIGFSFFAAFTSFNIWSSILKSEGFE